MIAAQMSMIAARPRQDHLEVFLGHAGAGHDAGALDRGRGRDHGHPVHSAFRAGLVKQGDVQNHDGRGIMPGDESGAVGRDQRMHDPFKGLKSIGTVGQHKAQGGAVDAAILQHARKGRSDGRDRIPARRVKPMHRRIRVPDRMAKIAKHLRCGRFAHADAAGQAQPKAHARTARRRSSSTSGRWPNQRSNPGAP